MSKHELHRRIRDEIFRHLSPWLVDFACTRNRCEYSFIGKRNAVVIGHEFCTHAWIEVDRAWRYDDAEDTDEAHLDLVIQLIECAEVVLANPELAFPQNTENRWTPPGQQVTLERIPIAEKGFFGRLFGNDDR